MEEEGFGLPFAQFFSFKVYYDFVELRERLCQLCRVPERIICLIYGLAIYNRKARAIYYDK